MVRRKHPLTELVPWRHQFVKPSASSTPESSQSTTWALVSGEPPRGPLQSPSVLCTQRGVRSETCPSCGWIVFSRAVLCFLSLFEKVEIMMREFQKPLFVVALLLFQKNRGFQETNNLSFPKVSIRARMLPQKFHLHLPLIMWQITLLTTRESSLITELSHLFPFFLLKPHGF